MCFKNRTSPDQMQFASSITSCFTGDAAVNGNTIGFEGVITTRDGEMYPPVDGNLPAQASIFLIYSLLKGHTSSFLPCAGDAFLPGLPNFSC